MGCPCSLVSYSHFSTDSLRVTRLRGLARAAVAGPDGAHFPLTPEEIKFARKDDLIRTLTEFAQTTGNLPDLNMVEKE